MDLIARARYFIETEAKAVSGLTSVLGPPFEQAVNAMLQCRGRVICIGMGKAGLIARKIAATLASTGTPAFFVHPAEAIHGDLGMITADDVVLSLSNSGQTEEVVRIIPFFKHVGATLIAITSRAESDLARHSDISLILGIDKEACPLNLAPTSSTTAMLVLGDTLALTLLEARGFGPEDYAVFHPGGALGRRLLTKVSDIMHAGEENPIVRQDVTIKQAVIEMTSKKLACTTVVDGAGKLVGFFTDGDLRRYLFEGNADLEVPISTVMTKNPRTVNPAMMAVKALEILRQYKIIELPVVDDDHMPIGLIHLHDITRAGIT
ncbi:MAG: KpsF/GutQ family sugar-phosphate isomerase [Candidatus Sumerlaeia bacterium]|nr:KpsF/GutQ family sugar-phosphate isomerase [Candidatus Sumerlaeia bacterium]